MTYKEATREKLMSIYEEQGFTKAVEMAKGIYHSTAFIDDIDFRRDLQGEACECLLELLILNERKTNPKAAHWCYTKGTVLKDRLKVRKNFFTEIDFILYTAQCVYIFECKSYAGNKVLTGEGLLTRDSGNSCDVYRQSRLHYEVLMEWLRDFTVKGAEPLIQMCMFEFSNGTLEDKRSRAAKIEMPCLTVDNLMSYVNTPGDVVWDMTVMPQVCRKFDEMSEKLRSNHLEYVKSLHGGEK